MRETEYTRVSKRCYKPTRYWINDAACKKLPTCVYLNNGECKLKACVRRKNGTEATTNH